MPRLAATPEHLPKRGDVPAKIAVLKAQVRPGARNQRLLSDQFSRLRDERA